MRDMVSQLPVTFPAEKGSDEARVVSGQKRQERETSSSPFAPPFVFVLKVLSSESLPTTFP